MPYGNVGSRMVQNMVAMDQNDRAQENQDMKKDDWELNRPVREAKAQYAEDSLSARDADAVSYGDKYGYAMELKRRNDQVKQQKDMLFQAKYMKQAALGANISATGADNSMIKYGISGSNRDLSNVAKHTSGSGQPNQAGFYQVGPMQVRPIQYSNMTEKQRAQFDKIQADRKERVKSGIYEEKTFSDGVKRFINTVTGNIFGTNVFMEDDRGNVISSEHLSMVTGQGKRASEMKAATTVEGTKESAQPTTTETTSSPEGIDEGTGVDPYVEPTPEAKGETTQTTGVDFVYDKLNGKEAEGLSSTEINKQYDAMSEDWHTKTLKTQETLVKGPKGSAMFDLGRVMEANMGPKTDGMINDWTEKYPNEMKNMNMTEFNSFLKAKEVKAPSKVAAVGTAKDMTTTSDPNLFNKLSKEVAINKQNKTISANKVRGSQKATQSQQKFIAAMDDPENINKAIKDGAKSFKDLEDWVEGKGKFKQMTAKEKRDMQTSKVKDDFFNKAYIKDEKSGKSAFSVDAVANIDPKEAAKTQNQYAKNTDLKKSRETLTAAKEWFDSREEVLKIASKARKQYNEPINLVNSFTGKWLGGSEEDKKTMTQLYAKLESITSASVANRVKLLSGTAASDKERATIMRFMFGDPKTSYADFEGALKGSTAATLIQLKNAIKPTFDSGGFGVAQTMAETYNKHKGDADIKSSKTKELSETRRIIASRIDAGTWTRPIPQWYKDMKKGK